MHRHRPRHRRWIVIVWKKHLFQGPPFCLSADIAQLVPRRPCNPLHPVLMLLSCHTVMGSHSIQTSRRQMVVKVCAAMGDRPFWNDGVKRKKKGILMDALKSHTAKGREEMALAFCIRPVRCYYTNAL